ncbi:MAG: ATP-binding cassette domain-containing protein, partial [Bacteroidota bacterium]
ITKKLALPTGESWLKAAFTVSKGDFVTLSGKSGAGKTTLLKILAGLLKTETGTIKVSGETWLDTRQKVCLSPQQRSVGMVFQDYALFPNLTVRQNLAFGLADKKNQTQVDDILQATGLAELQSRYPNTLSGGQQQRVALARTLVRKPSLLLLDEPFSALDAETKAILREELVRIHRTFGLTTVLVTHDLAEVYTLSDYVIELEAGQIKRQGKARDLFQSRELSAKFQFFGQVISLTPSDVVYIVEVLIDDYVVKMIATEAEAQTLKVGDQVRVTTKAFNPIIMKV